jgi:drug/metabolite transporter (DMT)-like permease
LISNVLPFVVMVLAHFFIPGDRISLKKTSGLVLGFAGVLVLLADSIMLSGDVLTGDILVLLAVLVWGCNAVYSKRIIKDFQPFQITIYPMLMSLPFFVTGMFLFDDPMVRHVDTPVITSMLYQIFVTASFGMVAWSSLIKKYGATAVHAFVFIMPVSGVFFGIVLLGEPLTINLAASIVLVTAGLIVLNRKRRKITVIAIDQPIRSDKEQMPPPNNDGEVS